MRFFVVIGFLLLVILESQRCGRVAPPAGLEEKQQQIYLERNPADPDIVFVRFKIHSKLKNIFFQREISKCLIALILFCI